MMDDSRILSDLEKNLLAVEKGISLNGTSLSETTRALGETSDVSRAVQLTGERERLKLEGEALGAVRLKIISEKKEIEDRISEARRLETLERLSKANQSTVAEYDSALAELKSLSENMSGVLRRLIKLYRDCEAQRNGCRGLGDINQVAFRQDPRKVIQGLPWELSLAARQEIDKLF